MNAGNPLTLHRLTSSYMAWQENEILAPTVFSLSQVSLCSEQPAQLYITALEARQPRRRFAGGGGGACVLSL